MADAAPGQLIGAASALQDSRPGLRFTLPDGADLCGVIDTAMVPAE